MKLSWFAAAFAVLSLALGTVARAQTAPTRYAFVTVDAVAAEPYRLWVTGIVEGEAAAREVQILFSTLASDYAATAAYVQTCERKALLAMAKPGQYQFEASSLDTFFPVCKLTRVNP